MFCPKCGTRVADDDFACYMCGSRLNNNVRSALDKLIEEDKKRLKEGKHLYEWERTDDPIEATVRELFKERTDEGVRAAVRPDASAEHIAEDRYEEPGERRSRKPVVIAVVCFALAALAAGGAYLWKNRPDARMAEAIEAEDIQTITEIYDQLPSEEKKEEVKVSMIERVRELRDKYLDEEISYDEVMDEYGLLEDKVFEDSDEFKEIKEEIERINSSRRAFDKAERDFMHARYVEAIAGYDEVLEEDERYYIRAQENKEKCSLAIADMLLGSWSYEYDARKEVEAYVKEKGFTVDLSKMKIPIMFLFDLKADGSIDVSVDYDALNDYIDKILDLAVDAVNNGLSTEGLSSPEISQWIKYMYGASGVKESIKKKLNIREALDGLLHEAGVDEIDSYRVEDGRLYIGETCMNVDIKDNELTLTSDESNALAIGKYEMKFPIKMIRNVEEGEEEKHEDDH